MDKERAPKVRLYGAQPLVRTPKAGSYETRPSLHDRAGTFAGYIAIASLPSWYIQSRIHNYACVAAMQSQAGILHRLCDRCYLLQYSASAKLS